jgi:hypothetical protein
MKRKNNVEKQVVMLINYACTYRMISYTHFDMTPRRCKKLHKSINFMRNQAFSSCHTVVSNRPELIMYDDIIRGPDAILPDSKIIEFKTKIKLY